MVKLSIALQDVTSSYFLYFKDVMAHILLSITALPKALPCPKIAELLISNSFFIIQQESMKWLPLMIIKNSTDTYRM